MVATLHSMGQGQRKKGVVLIVDDNQTVRNTLTQVLRLNDYEPAAASGSREALRLISEVRPDVALVDIILGSRPPLRFKGGYRIARFC